MLIIYPRAPALNAATTPLPPNFQALEEPRVSMCQILPVRARSTAGCSMQDRCSGSHHGQVQPVGSCWIAPGSGCRPLVAPALLIHPTGLCGSSTTVLHQWIGLCVEELGFFMWHLSLWQFVSWITCGFLLVINLLLICVACFLLCLQGALAACSLSPVF